MFFLLLLTHQYFFIGFYLDYGAKEFVPVIEVRIKLLLVYDEKSICERVL